MNKSKKNHILPLDIVMQHFYIVQQLMSNKQIFEVKTRTDIMKADAEADVQFLLSL